MKEQTEFTIKNLNKEKTLKEIVKIASIKNIKFEDKLFKFTVNKNKEKQIKKILEKKYIIPDNIRRFGIFNNIINSVFKLGIICPIFIFSIFLIISNNYVFKYEIFGINLIKQSQVESILKECNAVGIKQKSCLNTKQIENNILKINEVSLVSCIIKGNTLVINIKEKVYNDEYENKDQFKPIVAKAGGTITMLEVVQGTPLVKVGQTVKEGQELIAPYVIDTSGNRLAVKPMANIIADVYYTTITYVADEQILYKDTNEYVTKSELFLFGTKIFEQEIKCKYKHYRKEVSEEWIGGNSILPIKYLKTKYIKQEEIIETDYFKKNQEQIIKNCKEKTRQNLASYDIIKEEYYQINSNAGINQITYVIAVNKTIVY